MCLITLIIWCSLCLQTIADPLISSEDDEPYGQEVTFRADPPILHVPSPPSSSSTAPFSGLQYPLPYSPIYTNITGSDLQVAVDGMVVFILPHNNSSMAKASGMDQPSRPLLMAYYPDWVGDEFPPEKIDFSRFDWLDFAFAVPDSQFQLVWDDDVAPGLLVRLVALAHAAGAKVKLSIGGWTGSKYFSPAMSTEENRRIFAGNILGVYDTYHLDGIDIDWEYPGHGGDNGNFYDPADTSNFLAFLKILRTILPASAKISAAVQTLPFLGESGDPISDTSEFGILFDWILLMNYDTWESTSPPGPNAPLDDACHNSTQPSSSASAGVVAWVQSGFPISKLVLGLPSYGYVQRSTSERLRTRWHSFRGHHHWHDHEDSERHHDHDPEIKGNWPNHDDDGSWSNHDGDEGWKDHDGDGLPNDSPSTPPKDPDAPRPVVVDDSDAQVQFRDLVKQGVLILSPSTNDTVQYVGGGGFERRWDSCSGTPFLKSVASGQIVTYDDTLSLALKARFAKEVGMLGVNMFDIHGDTDEHHLIDAIRVAMGL